MILSETLLRQKYDNNKRLLFFCLLAALVWGLAAHGYMFLHSSFSHDSLAEIYDSRLWKISLGRIVDPGLRRLTRGLFTLPWLVGLLSLFYLGLSAFFCARLLHIKKRWMLLLAVGVFCVNPSVTALFSTYMTDADCYCFAVTLACSAAFLWHRYPRGFLWAVLPLGLAAGIYQSSLSVAAALILLRLILDLLEGADPPALRRRLGKALSLLVGSVLLYGLLLLIIPPLRGVSLSSGNYNSPYLFLSLSPSTLVRSALKLYPYTLREMLVPVSMYGKGASLAIHLLLAALGFGWLLRRLLHLRAKAPSVLLLAVLLLLLPPAMNFSYFLCGGRSHDLMHFALWFEYLLVLLVLPFGPDGPKSARPLLPRLTAGITALAVFACLWSGVVTANGAYLKKDLETRANLALFSRIVSRMEACPDYIPGETPVVFVGSPDPEKALTDELPGLDPLFSFVGHRSTYTPYFSTPDRLQTYFRYVLLNPAKMADPDTWEQISLHPEVLAMPTYPADGSIAVTDGVLVVRLSE